ncbi:hypothetical protein ACVWW5_008013 [Bradyrhizobium sp. LM3.4]
MKNNRPASSTMFSASSPACLHRLQPLQRIGHGLERQIERRRQGDDTDAGDDLDVEFQPLRHDENRSELAEHREPAQPQDRVQADMPLRGAEVGSGNFSHVGQFCGAFSITNAELAEPPGITSLALSAAIAEERPA